MAEVVAARHGERRVERHARVALAVRSEVVDGVWVRVLVRPGAGLASNCRGRGSPVEPPKQAVGLGDAGKFDVFHSANSRPARLCAPGKSRTYYTNLMVKAFTGPVAYRCL